MMSLNKRSDKTLDELIIESTAFDSGVLNVAVADMTVAQTVMKVDGSGRIYDMVAMPRITAGETDVFELIIDGEVVISLTLKNESVDDRVANLIFNKSFFIDMGKYSSYYFKYTSTGNSLRMYLSNQTDIVVNPIATLKITENKTHMIVVPNHIKFEKSFEIRMTRKSSSSSDLYGTNYALVGYKLN